MTRPHDMGGRFGDGPVQPEPQGIAQSGAEWHPRALALTLAAGAHGKWNIDTSRHAREALAPKDYAKFSYYEKWMAGLGFYRRRALFGVARTPGGHRGHG